jgi:hypothetical protein
VDQVQSATCNGYFDQNFSKYSKTGTSNGSAHTPEHILPLLRIARLYQSEYQMPPEPAQQAGAAAREFR